MSDASVDWYYEQLENEEDDVLISMLEKKGYHVLDEDYKFIT